MHFCVSATRGGFHTGFCCPRKIGTNWFMPALVKSRLGASGSKDDEGTMVCCFSRKKSRKDWRISAEVMPTHSNWLDARRKDGPIWRHGLTRLRPGGFENAIHPQIRAPRVRLDHTAPSAYC